MFKSLGMAIGLVLLAGTTASAQDNWTWHKALAAGKTLQINNVIGNITATAATGSEVEVVARRRNADDVQIKVKESSNGVVICTIYHNNDDCGEHHESHRGNRRSAQDERVDFEVRVPRGVELSVGTVQGRVEATGMTADVNASSVTGDVRVSTTGIASATSVSGSIYVRIGSNDWDALSFNTVSGDIVLELPAQPDATVHFNTVSGDFDSDWPISVTTKRESMYGPRGGLRGTIGRGNRRLSFSTVSGDVELRQSR
ncbi:MAG TPA: DUF4097 family beta strand repeat-containing protein [Longimicrobiales bacterium]|nr:DUF4097 family beta strand repeat-containing protein [Longimicrobiales bacterium]